MLGCDARKLRDRKDEIPPNADGKYSVKQIVDWFKVQLNTDDESLAAQKLSLEVQRLENQVRAQEVDHQVNCGKLIDREQVLRRFDRAAELMKAAGEKIARKKSITGSQAQAIFNAALDKAVREIEGV